MIREGENRPSLVPRPLSVFCVGVGKKGSGGPPYVVLFNREYQKSGELFLIYHVYGYCTVQVYAVN